MYDKILVALDGSRVAEEALPYVEGIAGKTGSELVLIRVSPPPQAIEDKGRVISTVEQVMENVRAETIKYLKGVANRLQANGLKTHLVASFGNSAEQIVDYAGDRENGIDLIAMCTHGRSGVNRWVNGSVADRVLRASPTPVLLVRWSGSK